MRPSRLQSAHLLLMSLFSAVIRLSLSIIPLPALKIPLDFSSGVSPIVQVQLGPASSSPNRERVDESGNASGDADSVASTSGKQTVSLVLDTLSASVSVFAQESGVCGQSPSTCYELLSSQSARICHAERDADHACEAGSGVPLECREPYLSADTFLSDSHYGETYSVFVDGRIHLLNGIEGVDDVSITTSARFSQSPQQSYAATFPNKAVRFVKGFTANQAGSSTATKLRSPRDFAGGFLGVAGFTAGCRSAETSLWENLFAEFNNGRRLWRLFLQHPHTPPNTQDEGVPQGSENDPSSFIEVVSARTLQALTAQDQERTAPPLIRWGEESQRDKYINRARYEFVMYNPQLCGVDLFAGLSSNWQVVLDTRSQGLTLPMFLFSRLVAQLAIPGVLECRGGEGGVLGSGVGEEFWGGTVKTSAGVEEENGEGSSPVEKWVFREQRETESKSKADDGKTNAPGKMKRKQPNANYPCHYVVDPRRKNAENLLEDLPVLSFALKDLNEYATSPNDDYRLKLPLSKLLVKDSSSKRFARDGTSEKYHLAISPVRHEVITDGNDIDGLEQDSSGRFTPNMGSTHISFGALAIAAFPAGIIVDADNFRIGFVDEAVGKATLEEAGSASAVAPGFDKDENAALEVVNPFTLLPDGFNLASDAPFRKTALPQQTSRRLEDEEHHSASGGPQEEGFLSWTRPTLGKALRLVLSQYDRLMGWVQGMSRMMPRSPPAPLHPTYVSARRRLSLVPVLGETARKLQPDSAPKAPNFTQLHSLAQLLEDLKLKLKSGVGVGRESRSEEQEEVEGAAVEVKKNPVFRPHSPRVRLPGERDSSLYPAGQGDLLRRPSSTAQLGQAEAEGEQGQGGEAVAVQLYPQEAEDVAAAPPDTPDTSARTIGANSMNYCAATALCLAGSEQRYNAALNRCENPDCGLYFFGTLDEATKTCRVHPVALPLLVTFVFLLAAAELLVDLYYRERIVNAVSPSGQR